MLGIRARGKRERARRARGQDLWWPKAVGGKGSGSDPRSGGSCGPCSMSNHPLLGGAGVRLRLGKALCTTPSGRVIFEQAASVVTSPAKCWASALPMVFGRARRCCWTRCELDLRVGMC
jgi:hypothetical protein